MNAYTVGIDADSHMYAYKPTHVKEQMCGIKAKLNAHKLIKESLGAENWPGWHDYL